MVLLVAVGRTFARPAQAEHVSIEVARSRLAEAQGSITSYEGQLSERTRAMEASEADAEKADAEANAAEKEEGSTCDLARRLRDEWRSVERELNGGFYCSECSRAASEIEASGGESFGDHLSRVKGTPTPAPQSLVQSKRAEYGRKIDAAASKCRDSGRRKERAKDEGDRARRLTEQRADSVRELKGWLSSAQSNAERAERELEDVIDRRVDVDARHAEAVRRDEEQRAQRVREETARAVAAARSDAERQVLATAAARAEADRQRDAADRQRDTETRDRRAAESRGAAAAAERARPPDPAELRRQQEAAERADAAEIQALKLRNEQALRDRVAQLAVARQEAVLDNVRSYAPALDRRDETLSAADRRLAELRDAHEALGRSDVQFAPAAVAPVLDERPARPVAAPHVSEEERESRGALAARLAGVATADLPARAAAYGEGAIREYVTDKALGLPLALAEHLEIEGSAPLGDRAQSGTNAVVADLLEAPRDRDKPKSMFVRLKAKISSGVASYFTGQLKDALLEKAVPAAIPTDSADALSVAHREVEKSASVPNLLLNLAFGGGVKGKNGEAGFVDESTQNIGKWFGLFVKSGTDSLSGEDEKQ